MKQLLIITAICLLFIACRKDKTPPDEALTSCNQPLENSPSSILAGDTSGMYVFDSTQVATLLPYGSVQLHIPIWCRDTTDAIITTTFVDGPGPSNSSHATLSSGSTFEFLQAPNADTIYWLNDTSYSGSSPVVMTILSGNKTCSYEPSVDSVFQLNDLLSQLDAGDQISISDYFDNSASLVGSTTGAPPGVDQTNPDTTVYTVNYYSKSSCNNLSSTPVYVGFKAQISGVEKLGWMLMSNDAGTVNVYEIAIQL